MEDPTIRPDALFDALADIGPKLEAGRKIGRDISRIAGLLAPIRPSDLPQAENEIVAAASLYLWRREWSVIETVLTTKVSDAVQLALVKGLKYVFIFHRDGRLREAALRKISGPLPNPFLFAAIAWRRNDWAAPVRQAAVDCAARTFPEILPEIVAEAGMTLLTRQAIWGRWGSERAVWDAAISRSDVARSLKRLFETQTTGPMASLLLEALRSGTSMSISTVSLTTQFNPPFVPPQSNPWWTATPSGRTVGGGGGSTRLWAFVAARQSLPAEGLRPRPTHTTARHAGRSVACGSDARGSVCRERFQPWQVGGASCPP